MPAPGDWVIVKVRAPFVPLSASVHPSEAIKVWGNTAVLVVGEVGFRWGDGV